MNPILDGKISEGLKGDIMPSDMSSQVAATLALQAQNDKQSAEVATMLSLLGDGFNQPVSAEYKSLVTQVLAVSSTANTQLIAEALSAAGDNMNLLAEAALKLKETTLALGSAFNTQLSNSEQAAQQSVRTSRQTIFGNAGKPAAGNGVAGEQQDSENRNGFTSR